MKCYEEYIYMCLFFVQCFQLSENAQKINKKCVSWTSHSEEFEDKNGLRYIMDLSTLRHFGRYPDLTPLFNNMRILKFKAHPSSRKLQGAIRRLIDGSKKCIVGWALNLRVRMSSKCAAINLGEENKSKSKQWIRNFVCLVYCHRTLFCWIHTLHVMPRKGKKIVSLHKCY